MAKTQLKKRKLTTQPNSTTTKNPKKFINKNKKPKTKASVSVSSSGSDSDSSSESIENLLEPLSKDQLITLLTNLALSNPSLSSRIHSLADSDISHRKIFIHGLPWDTTKEIIMSAFQPFGEIEDYNLVTDKVTGKAKGYAFITYKTRKGAKKALENPQKKICNRVVSCQLAAVGPGEKVVPGVGAVSDISGRKIYVSNVPVDVNVEKLRDFFAKFGDIESGPLGFDVETGKCKGYALFVYKSVDGARKALEEPYKVFEGKQLSCQKAAQGKSGGGAAGITTGMVPMPMSMPVQQQQQQQPMMTAAALQNLAFLGQNPNMAAAMGLFNMNPMYGAMIGNPSLMNMNAFGLGQVGAGGVAPGPMGMVGYGPYGGVLGSLGGANGVGSAGGAYGVGGVGPSAPVGHGLQQAYPAIQKSKTSSSPAKTPASGGRSSYLRGGEIGNHIVEYGSPIPIPHVDVYK